MPFLRSIFSPLFLALPNKSDEHSRALFFFSLLCIYQVSLQYICWTFQGARIYLEHHSIIDFSNFLLVFTLVSTFSFVVITPVFLHFFEKKSHLFAVSLLLQVVSFWSILIEDHQMSFLVFAILNGIGFGMFWCARYLFEILKTNNDCGTRDKLNSNVAAIHQLVLILLPFSIAALAAFSAQYFSLDPFLPVIILVTLFFLPSLVLCFKITERFPDVLPSIAHFNSILNAIKKSSFLGTKIYFFAYGTHWSLRNFAIALAGAIVAKDITTIGSSEATGALLAWVCLLLFHPFSRPSMRHYLFYIGSFGLAASWAFFGFFPTIISLFILAFSKSVFQPLLVVGNHLYSQVCAEKIIVEAQKDFSASTYKSTINTSTLTAALTSPDSTFSLNSSVSALSTTNYSNNNTNNNDTSANPGTTSMPPNNSSIDEKQPQFAAASIMLRELYISFWRIVTILAISLLLSETIIDEQLHYISISFALACAFLPICAHIFLHKTSPTYTDTKKHEHLSPDDCFIHPSFFEQHVEQKSISDSFYKPY